MSDPRRRGDGEAEEQGSLLGRYSWLLLVGLALALVLSSWMLAVAILGLAFLILVHEFGHFLFAKLFGMRVEKFYIGFPPAAAKRSRGETEYGFGWIPLGGFCKISGMTPDEPVAEQMIDKAIAQAKVGSITSTFTSAEIDAAREALRASAMRHALKSIAKEGREEDRDREPTLEEQQAALEMVHNDPKFASFREHDRVLRDRLDLLLVPGADPVYYKKPVWQRNLTIFGGPLMNFIAAVVIIFVFLVAAGVPKASLTVDLVMPRTPAAAIGMQRGDTLVGANGQHWTDWDQATAFLKAHPNKTIELTYRTPSGELKTTTVRLVSNPNDKRSGYLGVRVGETTSRPNPINAARTAVTTTGDVIYRTFEGFYLLATGKINPTGPDGAVGPVGIVSVSQQAVQQHWYPLFLAFISVNLGIINLLPILPFDGGHIFFNTLERVRGGRRVDRRVIERIVAVSVAVLITLFIFLTFNDISRLISG